MDAHLTSNETPWEKARWELHKTTARRLEQMLGATSHKTAAVRTLTSHHTKQPSKMNKAYWGRRSKDKLISDVFQCTTTHERASVGQPTRIYIYQFCADTGCSINDLLVAMDHKKRWREKVSKPRAINMTYLYYIYIYIYIYIRVCKVRLD